MAEVSAAATPASSQRTHPPPEPDFFSRAWLAEHERWCAEFYEGRNVDRRAHALGGFFQCFKDDGTVFDENLRHVVSSTRFVLNYSWLWDLAAPDSAQRAEYVCLMRHGVKFLRDAHRHPQHGGYSWTLRVVPGDAQTPATLTDVDRVNQCYALQFISLAYAHAMHVGIVEAAPWLDETLDLLNKHFWREADGLYADSASEDWSKTDSYRGVNANMHGVEAAITVFEITGRREWLLRAADIAFRITVELANEGGGLVWEHYDEEWKPLWTYNKVDATPEAIIFRPYGFQPGHLGEWAKLLCQLHHHRDSIPAEHTQKWRERILALTPNQRTKDTLRLAGSRTQEELAQALKIFNETMGVESVQSATALRALTLATAPSFDIIASLQAHTSVASSSSSSSSSSSCIEWFLIRAASLFAASVAFGWDVEHANGGLCYSFGEQLDDFKQNDQGQLKRLACHVPKFQCVRHERSQ